jgi:predicted  nucleic acid-binding Zn-ribbon protein
MTQNEFEQLTGLNVTLNEYEVANAMYMSDENMDKQTFCKMFVNMNLINYVRNHASYIKKLRDEIDTLNDRNALDSAKQMQRFSQLNNEIEQGKAALKAQEGDYTKFLGYLVEVCHNDEDILDALRMKMGTVEYLKALRDHELTPTKEDLDMIIKEIAG